MRIVFWILVIVAVFSFIVFKSGTWEVRRTTAVRDGVEYYTTEHVIHWDRFVNYVKNIPQQVKKQVEAILNK